MLIHLPRPKHYALNFVLFALVLIGLTTWLDSTGAVLRMKLDGANSPAEVKGIVHSTAAKPTAEAGPASIQTLCGTLGFSRADLDVGTNPFSVAVGDFNSDGKADLAVANSGSNSVSIFLGTGTGRFASATSFAVGSSPISIAVGDFNGDGKADLAVANQNSNNVSILFGTGTGSFSAATNFDAGTNPSSIAVGDLDGDGKLDLAVANSDSSSVSILLGTDTGSFYAATNFAAGTSPEFVAAADFNNDGKIDLAVTNSSDDSVSILLSTGTGSFETAAKFAAGTSPRDLAKGDFNADGNIDLAVANSDSSSVSILLGTGMGSFGKATSFDVGGDSRSLAVADFNGDGKDDLVIVSVTPKGNIISIMLNTCGPDVAATPTALINGGTVTGGASSQEAQAATAKGYAVTVVSQATWAAMTQAQFGAYDLLIIGDPTCSGSSSQAAAANAATWAPVVMGTAGGRTLAGNRILIGTDPVLHDGGSYLSVRATIIRTGIAFAGKQPGRTGLYFDASCSGSGGNILAALNLLKKGSGSWTGNDAPPCGGSVSLIASEPSFASLTTDSLQGWSCSVHETWPTFPTDWNALAVATDTATKPTCGIDPNTGVNACGQAYILIAGSSIVVVSGSISVSPTNATSPVGTNHTVTARVTSGGSPLANQVVTFTVTGQNAGVVGTCVPSGCKTDSNGNVSFTYFDANGAGDDTITASFTDGTGSLQSATAQKRWNVSTVDLAVTLADSPDPVLVGNNLNYAARVSNNSSSPATGVTLTDTLPAGTTFVSAIATQGTCAVSPARVVTCNFGNLTATGTPGATATAIITVKPTAVGTLTNTVRVSGTETDTNPSNNTATTTTTVVALSIAGQVTDGNNIGISGVIITLSGSQTGSTTTDATGNYSLPNLQAGGNYTVTPSKASFIFTPPSQSFNNLNANQTANFTGTAIVNISGQVTDGNNIGISGVIITLSGSQTDSRTTDANGNYSLANLPAGGNYTVTPSKASFIFTPPSQSFNNLNANQTANFTGTAIVNISGRVTDGSNNGISGVQVVLSGTLTRVVQTDAAGNYSFNNLVGGGNYSVIASSPLYVFAPPRFDFTNLSGNQIANFAQVPNAVPSPTPALVDNFAGAQRDPAKWNLGTATQPAGAFDPQVTVAQTNGQLVIAPRSNVSGPHYNGYVSVNSFDLTGGTASVEVAKAATGGADTIFAIGSDSNNFYRFKVHTAGLPNGLAPVVKNQNGVTVQADPTLLLQVVIAGQLTTLDIAYDAVQHKFMRFRHESAPVAPPSGAIVFEASPDELSVPYTVLRRTPLPADKPVDPMTIELSAGTTSATNTDAAKFDNVKLVLSTFQFSSGAYSVGETEGSVLITVTRVGDKSTVGTVDFATKDGTALQGTKYTQTTGKLTFAANEASKTFTVSVVNNTLAEGDKTVNLELSNATGSGLNGPGRAVLTIIDNDTALTANQVTLKTWIYQGRTYAYLKLSFPTAGYRVASWGQAVRAGNDFTVDAAVEKLTGPLVQAETTTAGLYDLGPLADGTYNFNFKTSGTLAKTQQFTVTNVIPPLNPIDNAREFVRQQYRDFLNREPDQAGEDFWTDNITKCSNPARRPADQTEAQCTVRQRETTSGAFFQSPEFQYTGYYVYRMYQGALGRQPKLSEFITDAQFVGNGIIVNGQLSAAKINQNKAAFAQQFVNCTDATKYRCAEFKAIYDGLNNTQFVDKLFQTTGVNASATDRIDLVNSIGANQTRGSIVQKVVDGINVISEGNQQFTTTYGQAFYNMEFNRAFVELEYFGYMKRDPDDAGYAFWLGKLNQFGGNFVNAEMVLAFISSPEYRARFGQP